MKLKVNIMALFLIIIFSAICVSSIFLVTTTEKSILLSRISRGDYGQNAIHFYVNKETCSYNKTIDLIKNNDFNDCTLIYDDYEKNIRQIYIKGKNDPPPMISGRYFRTNDFNKGKAFAVIGQNHSNEIINKDGKQWISVEGKLFEVIGVMGYYIDTLLDDRIIVNADALLQEGKNNIYILDAYSGSGKDTSLKMYNALNELAIANNRPSESPRFIKLDIDSIGTDRLFNNLIKNTVLFVLLMACYMLCSISISFEWISKQRKNIAVMRLIGWSDRKLKTAIYRSYFMFAIIGVGISLIFTILFNIRITKIEYLFLIVIINLVFGWLITIPAINKMLEVSVTEVMG